MKVPAKSDFAYCWFVDLCAEDMKMTKVWFLITQKTTSHDLMKEIWLFIQANSALNMFCLWCLSDLEGLEGKYLIKMALYELNSIKNFYLKKFLHWSWASWKLWVVS